MLHGSAGRFMLFVTPLGKDHAERMAMAESERMQKLLQQKARIEARLKQQQRMDAEKERKRDTRRKVITGAIVDWVNA